MATNNDRPTSIEAAEALSVLAAAFGNQEQQPIQIQQQRHQQQQNLTDNDLSLQSTREILIALGLLQPDFTALAALSASNNLSTTSQNNNQNNIIIPPSPLKFNTSKASHNNASASIPTIYQPLPTRSGRIPQLPNPNSNNSNNRDTLLFNEWFDYADYPSSDEEDLDFLPRSEGDNVWDQTLFNGLTREGRSEAGPSTRKRSRKDRDNKTNEDKKLRDMMDGDLFSNDEDDDEEYEEDEESDGSNFDEPVSNHPSNAASTGTGAAGYNSPTTGDDSMLGGVSDPGTVGSESLYAGRGGGINNSEMDTYISTLESAATSTLPRLPRLHTLLPASSLSSSSTILPVPVVTKRKYTKKASKKLLNSSNIQIESPLLSVSPAPSSSGNLSPFHTSAIQSTTISNNLPTATTTSTKTGKRKPYRKKIPPGTVLTLTQAEEQKAEAERAILEKKEKNAKFQAEKRRKLSERDELIDRRLGRLEDENKLLRERVRELGGGDWVGTSSRPLNVGNHQGGVGVESREERETQSSTSGVGGDSNASWSAEGEEEGQSDRGMNRYRSRSNSPINANQFQQHQQYPHQQQQFSNNHLNNNNNNNNNSIRNLNVRIDGNGPTNLSGRNGLESWNQSQTERARR